MCTTCGCGTGEVTIDGAVAHQGHEHDHVHADGTTHSHDHAHVAEHAHEHGKSTVTAPLRPAHAHAPGLGAKRMVQIEQDILPQCLRRAEPSKSVDVASLP